ncbi:NAD(P)-dependent alcohol dehydrogenase [Nostoc sp. NIES-2111]
MKAAICTRYGPPEVLELREVPKPRPKRGEILVRVVASTVNSGDVRVRGLKVEGLLKVVMRLVLGFRKPRKPVLGTVFSGVVEEAGSDVSTFKIGDAVFGMTGFSFGTHAEYLIISQEGNVLQMPSNATFEEAAAILFGGHTAIYFLNKAKLSTELGKRILVIGATGSIGTSAIQIAKCYGAHVTAVCSSSGRSVVENLGISDIVVHDKEDFLNLPARFDFIFDAIGKTSKKQCRLLLKKGAVYQTVGGMEAASESIDQLKILKTLFEMGFLKAVIDRTYSLDEIVEAHRYVDTGRKKGNVVLKVSEVQT